MYNRATNQSILVKSPDFQYGNLTHFQNSKVLNASSQLHGLKRLNMNSYSLSNVLLPAVFISSAVFSTLTVPLALIKSEPVAVEVPPFFSGEIQPIFNGEHKEVAIPYVGFAIVVSVGAGIASVEVMRRLQTYRESLETQEQLPNLQQNSKGKEAQKETLKRPEYRPEASAIDLSTKAEGFSSQSISAPNNAITEAALIAVEAPEQVVDVTQLGLSQPAILHQTTANVPGLEKLNLSSSPHENDLVQLGSDGVGSQEAVQNLDITFSQILESQHLYQTCRIKVPHLKQRLLAILFDGQYYSFLRAEETKEKVLEIIEKLDHRVQKTVVTKTEKGYRVWVLEPKISSKISS